MDENTIPRMALSVRQPWAWAIIYAGKDIENRSSISISLGNMKAGRIAIHAATGMKIEEYKWAAFKLAELGIRAPKPQDLVRGAIIGFVEVTGIVSTSSSPWFGGPLGLRLENPCSIRPIPARGDRGYFEWVAGGEIAKPLPWMKRLSEELGLFGELGYSFKSTPKRPRSNRIRKAQVDSSTEPPS
jgi:hypothetical protein